MALVYLAIRLTVKEPGIFAQERIGYCGKRFTLYKLRTMYIDQNKRIDMEKIKEGESEGILFKMHNDPRVTPLGKILRKTSIDELPQLWNVVRGDMSLVGPRPLVPYMLAPYPHIEEKRCEVRPGISGKWQVSARNDNNSVLGMVNHDFDYVENYSLMMDIGILLKTFFVVVKGNGAH
jgi:lipopolysaccharide/colanic/teichoic acid biosynthesis glycosyltransferase